MFSMWGSVLFSAQWFLTVAALPPLGARPEGPRCVAASGTRAVWLGPGGAGPRCSRGAVGGGGCRSCSGPGSGGSGSSAPARGAPLGVLRAGKGGWPRVPGAVGGSSSSTSGSSSGGHREARGEAMVAAPARAHMPGARGRRGAAAGAREAGSGCRVEPGKSVK